MDIIEILPGLCVLAVLGLLVWIGVAVYHDSQSPTFELRKDEWVATKSHTETRTMMVMVGKVMVPQIHTVTVVDQYERIR